MKIVRKETYGRESTSSGKLKAEYDTSLLTFHEVHAKTKQGKCELLEKECIKKSDQWMGGSLFGLGAFYNKLLYWHDVYISCVFSLAL